MTSRAAISNPVPVTSTPSEYNSDRRRNMPPVAPPRTSSNTNSYNTPGRESSSRKREYNNPDKTASSPRRAHPDSSRMDINGNDADYAEAPSSRSRRAQMAQESGHRPSSSRDARASSQSSTAVPIRPHPQSQLATSTKLPSREASEVLNRIIVSQPESDLQREKERMAEALPRTSDDKEAPAPAVSAEHEESRRSGRSRHDGARRDKVAKFGDYVLGNTIGEGEFGKVKLGWKQDGGIQVAIKLIKRDSVGNNPSRLAKIYREISILRGIQHPNIVRLHEMVETERHIGIILEYASGGELFDYILNHRYLKDNAARRLFAQLVSGVGYLHKKGIVHRDLKLENLLLDRNRNIIITDFGFANTFDPDEDLSQDEELNLSDRDFVKRMGLDKLKANGTRKGDLMQTSCGSPCYAAPELVVSDSLYTGRKVDVWSCGVILYAMLAGYLPFDDDPANPEGDNINLLYKYIVNTPLTFPEYVTPHARDLLRRILVPNPRKRADLFEVARHSWLSEYAHVVEFITSSTTSPLEIQNTTVPAEDEQATIARSASLREPSNKSKSSGPTSVGGLANKHGNIDPEAEAAKARQQQQKESKRRTVQVEYVAPTTQTQRGDAATQSPGGRGKSKARSNSQGPVEVNDGSKDKPLPRDPPVSKDNYSKSSRQATRPPTSYRNTSSRAGRDTRSSSENVQSPGTASGRPQTGGSMRSTGSMGLGSSARASYGQPIPPSVAGTNAQGSIQQPNTQDSQSMGHPSIGSMPTKYARATGYPRQGPGSQPQSPATESAKGHRRSSTLGDIGSKLLGRNGSVFGAKNRKRSEQQGDEKASRKYPPVSMPNHMAGGGESRASMDSRASRRSFSLGFGKKRSGSISGSQTSQEKQNRRFSLIPPSISKAMGMGKEPGTPPRSGVEDLSQQDLPIQEPPEVGDHPPQSRGQSRGHTSYYDGAEPEVGSQQQPNARHQRYPSAQYGKQTGAIPSHMQQGAVLNTGSESSLEGSNHRRQVSMPYQSGGFADSDGYDGRKLGSAKDDRKFLQKNKRFTDAYDQDDYHRGHHDGSSGAAKRVMDFFRRRGRARGGEER